MASGLYFMGICFSSNASRSSEASLAALRIRLSTELGRTEGTDFSLFPSRPSPFDNASPRRVEPLAKTTNARSGKTPRIKNMAKCGRSYVPVCAMSQAQCNAPAQVRTSELRCHLPMLDKHGGILLVLSLILDSSIVGACCLVSDATPILHDGGIDYHRDSIALPLFFSFHPLRCVSFI